MKTWLQKLEGAEFKILRLQETATDRVTTDTPERIAAYVRPLMENSTRYNQDCECFGVVLLSTRRKPIGMEIISNGTLDTLLVHPREVFRPAIIMPCSAIVLFHNHPSGDYSPSDADIKVTRNLIQAGQLLRIDVLDHIILGTMADGRTRNYCSLRELGYFTN